MRHKILLVKSNVLSFRHALSRNLFNSYRISDHSITLAMILFVLFLFSALQLSAQEQVPNKNESEYSGNIKNINGTQTVGDKVEFKNSSGNSILTISDEGNNASSLLLPTVNAILNGNKLYNNGGNLYWNGTILGSGGATELDDLTDAKYDNTSLFLGLNSGFSDDGTTTSGNLAFGRQALYSNISNGSNTAIGNFAISNLTGLGNTALGYFAMSGGGTTKDASNNTAIGSAALRFVDKGFENVAIGNSVLLLNANGNKNTAIGFGVLSQGSTGDKNVVIGHNADAYGGGSNNTIIGFEAGFYNNPTSKSGSVFLGYQAGYFETSNDKLYIENSNSTTPLLWGDFNKDSIKINGNFHVSGNITTEGSIPGISQLNDLIDSKTGGNSVFLGSGAGANDDASNNKNYGFGTNSLFTTTSGFSNAAVGFNTLYFNTVGSHNIGLGQGALYYNSLGNGNVAVGYHSNHHNQTGSNNTILGHEAGRGVATHNKSGNIFIGHQAGYNETTSNKLYIENSNSSSPLIWGDFTTNDIKINGDFHVTGNLTSDNPIIASDNDWDTGLEAGAVVLYNGVNRVGIGTNGATLEPKLHVKGDEGVLFQGTHGNGTALNLDTGTRFHFYPKKSAIRGGYVSNDQWDDINIGEYSISLGTNTQASGWSSVAFGYGTIASASYSTAIGYGSTASGNTSNAIGFQITASGQNSFAMGNYVSTNSKNGAFILGDNSTTTATNSSVDNQITMRFAGGYRFYSNSTLSYGVYMNSGVSGWTNISDRNKKENFEEIDDEKLLGIIRELPVTKWNYKNTDPSVKYVGPMAQDFYKAFGLGGIDSLGINSIAIDGINLAGVKALEIRTSAQEETIKKLETKINELEELTIKLKKRSFEAIRISKILEDRLVTIEKRISSPQLTMIKE